MPRFLKCGRKRCCAGGRPNRSMMRACLVEAMECRRMMSGTLPFFNTIKSLTIGTPYSPYSGMIRDSSGNFYGTTALGGLYDEGAVYELSGTTLTTLVSFSGDQGTTLGEDPLANLLMDSSGNLYGTTSTGGTTDDGTLFELSGTSHSVFTTLANFTGDAGGNPGSGPQGSLAIDSSGDIFGTTSAGGTYECGTAFELAGASHAFVSLFSFTGSAGSYLGDAPDSGLVIDTSGNLYGTTDDGGSDSAGQVFEISGSTHTTFNSIYSFVNDGDVYPNSLLLDSSNNLYGTTLYAGANGDGSVYELAVTSHAFTNLVTFTGQSMPDPGEAPCPEMVLYGGNLYGMTSDGGVDSSGNIFELSGTTHQTFTPVDGFTGSGESIPYGGLCVDSSGNLYGTTAFGGTYGQGNIFQDPISNRANATTLISFNAGGGALASSALIYSGGNLYGTTAEGGPTDDGGVYELSGTGFTTYSAEYFASGAGQGSTPNSSLLVDSSGNDYGTTYGGGANSTGAVYEIAAATHVISTLYSFPADSGNAGTTSYLTIDSTGNLYVAYTIGDGSNDGTVVEIAATTHAVTTLVSFTGTAGTDAGDVPGQILVYGGNLYGTTQSGGTYNDGVLYELAGTTHTYTKIFTFNTSNGSTVGPNLMVDSSGNFYGTTATGGAYGDGTVFVNPAAKRATLTTLFNFNGSNGATPEPMLATDSSGDLYGTTLSGGINNDGTVFELSGTTHNTFTMLASFTGTIGSAPGAAPANGLTLDSSGNVYGSTTAGGAYNDGEVFQLTGTSHTTFNTLFPFDEGGTDAAPALVADSSGNLYGVTNSGGAYQLGSVFELNSAGVANINASSGSITIATPTNGNNYFNSITAGIGATVSIPVTTGGHSVIITGSVTVTGQVDITNNDLDIDNSSLTTVTNEVKQGYNNGTWTGQGITSSTAAGDTTHLTALGVIQNNQSGIPLFTSSNPLDSTTPAAADILVKYTYYGDANLSGKVDGSDYALIDNGYLNHLTGWYNGDFNYDGVINGSDFTLMDNTFNRQGASLTASVAPAAQVTKVGSRAARLAPLFSQSQIDPQCVDPQGQSSMTPSSIAAEIFSTDDAAGLQLVTIFRHRAVGKINGVGSL